MCVCVCVGWGCLYPSCLDAFLKSKLVKDKKDVNHVRVMLRHLVVGPDVSGEDAEVVEAQRHVIVHVFVQPLVGWTGVTAEDTQTHKVAVVLLENFC